MTRRVLREWGKYSGVIGLALFWALPVAGGTVFTVLVVIWLTSSFWFFTSIEFPGF